jgi:dihydrofolate reductase
MDMASGGLLLGRRIYQDVLAYWNTQDSPFRDAEPLSWPNSTLLSGDIPTAVAKLKQTPGTDLHIRAAVPLIQDLGATGLIDEYMLSIPPGRRSQRRREQLSG